MKGRKKQPIVNWKAITEPDSEMTQMLKLYTGILNDCDYFGKEFSCDVYKQMGALSRG